MSKKRTVYYHGDKHQTGFDIIAGRHSQRLDLDDPIPEGWSEDPSAPIGPVVAAVVDDMPSIKEMSKLELDEYAASIGISLDRRKSKENMLNDFWKAVK